jgi:hypothetical protein
MLAVPCLRRGGADPGNNFQNDERPLAWAARSLGWSLNGASLNGVDECSPGYFRHAKAVIEPACDQASLFDCHAVYLTCKLTPATPPAMSSTVSR